ncbi:3-oxoacyl-[acyl-carrier-protein] reductase FabG-like [Cydia pomonella]|uniref:3-oxoacyl-[acyl-carrier-protein] reductase FabG-like n=1 Tax=Cydia pomonella TaxID=82600 RepID=UPI002ADD57EA|nr:3-oxoacyl-[acyl-carrier-protein] reductase FabG-like [Cydia pomonella]
MSFTGKVAIVTGAASGIGAATSKALAIEGAKVVLVDKDEAKLQEVAKQCAQHGSKPLIITADITIDEDVRTIVKNTIDNFGQLDVLVNNAGTTRHSSILDENLMEHFDLLMNTNLRSMVYLTHLAAPYLIKTKGNIVNLASIVGLRVLLGSLLSYSVSKAGVTHFTRCVALDLAPHGVRVNAVAPGGTKTNIIENAGMSNVEETMEVWRSEHTELKKLSEPEEIADLILFLASDKARSVTGSTYVCDNGALLT